MTIAICIPKLAPTATSAESFVPRPEPRPDAAELRGLRWPPGDGGASAEQGRGARGQGQPWSGVSGFGGGSACTRRISLACARRFFPRLYT